MVRFEHSIKSQNHHKLLYVSDLKRNGLLVSKIMLYNR